MPQQSAVQEIPIDLIDLGANVRKSSDMDADVGLMGTIAEVGVLTPILVQAVQDRFLLITGSRRLRMAKRAGLKTISAKVLTGPLSEAEILQRQIIENHQRQDMNPVEHARGIDAYMKLKNFSATEAAKSLGMSGAGISNARALLRLPDAILARVESREISLSAAYELARVEDAQKQAELASDLLKGQLTRDRLVGRIKASRRKNDGPSAPSAPARVTAQLGNGRSVTVRGLGLSLDKLIEWLEELLTKARKVRPQALALPTFIQMLKDQAQA